jgi:hypothetical protein
VIAALRRRRRLEAAAGRLPGRDVLLEAQLAVLERRVAEQAELIEDDRQTFLAIADMADRHGNRRVAGLLRRAAARDLLPPHDFARASTTTEEAPSP